MVQPQAPKKSSTRPSTRVPGAAAARPPAPAPARATGSQKVPGMKVSGRIPVPEGAKLELVAPQATRARPKGSGAVAASHSLPKKRSSTTHAAVPPRDAGRRQQKGPARPSARGFPVELLAGIPIVLVVLVGALIASSGKTPPPATHTTTPAATAAPSPVAAPAHPAAAPRDDAEAAPSDAPAPRARGGAEAEPSAEDEAEFERQHRQREKELAEAEAKWLAEREGKVGSAPAAEPSAEPGSAD